MFLFRLNYSDTRPPLDGPEPRGLVPATGVLSPEQRGDADGVPGQQEPVEVVDGVASGPVQQPEDDPGHAVVERDFYSKGSPSDPNQPPPSSGNVLFVNK